MDTVKNVGSHSVDLDDGRTIEPGGTAENVNMKAHVNSGHADDGFLAVVVTEPEPSTEAPPAAATAKTKE